MSYDPTKFGARCDICPLRENGELRKPTKLNPEPEPYEPVSPELHEGSGVLAVAESPNNHEVEYGRPLVGPSGNEWARTLAAVGLKRPHIDLMNVICCKPPGRPGGAWQRMHKRLDLLNKSRRQKGKKPLPHPQECCRPHLEAHARCYRNIITLGKTAAQALTRDNRSMGKLAGDMLLVDSFTWAKVGSGRVEQLDNIELEGELVKVFPTWHPSYVLRAPAFRDVLQRQLGKAWRWFTGRLNWTPGDATWRPSPQELRQWLQESKQLGAPLYEYDVETTLDRVEYVQLKCLAISTPDMMADGRLAGPGEVPDILCRTVGVSLWAKVGAPLPGGKFYNAADEEEIKDILREFFVDASCVKLGHNAGYFDRMVIENFFDVTPNPCIDTLFLTRCRAPELPKGLKHIGNLLLDVDRWESSEKGEKHIHGEDPDDLLRYNLVDVEVGVRIAQPLIAVAREHGYFDRFDGWVTELMENGPAPETYDEDV
jgi:uracil-DNA glycosylase